MEINTEIYSQLPSSIQGLIEGLRSELNTYQKRCEQYSQAYELLQHQVQELLRYRFGKKSERFIDPENRQLDLFRADPITFSTLDQAKKSAESDDITVTTHLRKKKQGPKALPRRIEILPVSEEDKQCPCGLCKTVIRYEIKELLHYHPPVHEILEQRREVVACPKGCENQIKIAPAPLHVLPKAKVTEAFLAFLIVSKIDDRQPLYHLEKQLNERYGVDCSRQTMSRWLIDLTAPLQPVYNLLKDEIIAYDVASIDATTLQVLKEPGRRPETKSYVYCIRGGPPKKSVVLYEYNDKLHKVFVKEWFEGFRGYLHADGDNFFDSLGDAIKLVNCNAHSRRKFEPVAQGTKGKGIAKEALHYFKALYKIEREAKNNHLTPEQRYRLRQEKSKPLVEKFKSWVDEIYSTVLPQSTLGKAIQYMVKLWPGLTMFLTDGRLEIDNNGTEQQIKPFVIARKNFLFAASVDGANALCMHFSLIRSAKLHGLEPYHYYTQLLKSVPHCQSVEDYEKLLPWNILLDYAKS